MSRLEKIFLLLVALVLLLWIVSSIFARTYVVVSDTQRIRINHSEMLEHVSSVEFVVAGTELAADPNDANSFEVVVKLTKAQAP